MKAQLYQELLVVCNSIRLFNRILKQQQNILVVDSKGAVAAE